jgi:hypothetical protein
MQLLNQAQGVIECTTWENPVSKKDKDACLVEGLLIQLQEPFI